MNFGVKASCSIFDVYTKRDEGWILASCGIHRRFEPDAAGMEGFERGWTLAPLKEDFTGSGDAASLSVSHYCSKTTVFRCCKRMRLARWGRTSGWSIQKWMSSPI